LNDIINNDWMPLLQRFNALVLHSKRFSGDVAEQAVLSGWCGQAPGSEIEIQRAEMRLGVKLPPSYRAFLSISNGWWPFNSFVMRLLPVQEIDRFRILDPEFFASLERAHERLLGLHGDDVSAVPDEVYLDYATPAHNMAIRQQYYGDSLLISERDETELVLLNPFIVSADGEWETIFSAHWIPGNRRFRSFREFVEHSIRLEEEMEANQSS
jgi:hypothetical protein